MKIWFYGFVGNVYADLGLPCFSYWASFGISRAHFWSKNMGFFQKNCFFGSVINRPDRPILIKKSWGNIGHIHNMVFFFGDPLWWPPTFFLVTPRGCLVTPENRVFGDPRPCLVTPKIEFFGDPLLCLVTPKIWKIQKIKFRSNFFSIMIGSKKHL